MRQDRVAFWASIARGSKTEDAAVEAGGVNPCLPPTDSGRYLSFAEREDIAVWHAQKVGVREIARRLGRSSSTISRELRRNASTRTFRLEILNRGTDGAIYHKWQLTPAGKWSNWTLL